MKLAVVIPAYNEAQHITTVITHTRKIVTDVIVVNDGSSDDTATLAQEAGAIVLSHIVNLGKGAAAKTGCDYAYKQGYSAMVLMDADGQHLPENIPLFVRALHKAHIVFGYREQNLNAPIVLNMGNWGLTMLSKVLYGMPIKDTQSGFRAFTKKAYKQIRWDSRDYAMESEMIWRARHLTYTQIPIPRIYLDNTKGTTVLHGIKIGWQMMKWKLFGGN